MVTHLHGGAVCRAGPHQPPRRGLWRVEDRYHWRLLVRPSDLFELDSVVLLTIVIAGARGDYEFEELPKDLLGALVRAPLTAAEWFSRR